MKHMYRDWPRLAMFVKHVFRGRSARFSRVELFPLGSILQTVGFLEDGRT